MSVEFKKTHCTKKFEKLKNVSNYLGYTTQGTHAIGYGFPWKVSADLVQLGLWVSKVDIGIIWVSKVDIGIIWVSKVDIGIIWVSKVDIGIIWLSNTKIPALVVCIGCIIGMCWEVPNYIYTTRTLEVRIAHNYLTEILKGL